MKFKNPFVFRSKLTFANDQIAQLLHQLSQQNALLSERVRRIREYVERIVKLERHNQELRDELDEASEANNDLGESLMAARKKIADLKRTHTRLVVRLSGILKREIRA